MKNFLKLGIHTGYIYPTSPFILNDFYTIDNIKCKFIDRSRIDAEFIFEFDDTLRMLRYPITNHLILGMKIDSVVIVSNDIKDHIPRYKTFNENKDYLCKSLFDIFGITDDILSSKELCASKIRDIKIGLII